MKWNLISDCKLFRRLLLFKITFWSTAWCGQHPADQKQTNYSCFCFHGVGSLIYLPCVSNLGKRYRENALFYCPIFAGVHSNDKTSFSYGRND